MRITQSFFIGVLAASAAGSLFAVERVCCRRWSVEVDAANLSFSVECGDAPGGASKVAEGRILLSDGLAVAGKKPKALSKLDYSSLEIPLSRGSSATASSEEPVPQARIEISSDGNVSIAAPEGCRILGSLFWGEGGRRTIAVRADAPSDGANVVSGPSVPDGADALFDVNTDSLLTLRKARIAYDRGSGRYSFAADGELGLSCRRDVLSRRFDVKWRRPVEGGTFDTPPVGWMTWYAVKFDANEKIVLDNARGFLEKFRGYTDERPVMWVDWEWGHGKFHNFGEESEDVATPRASAYPRGLAPLAADLSEMGFTPALWVSVVNDCRTNAFWRSRPEWVLGEWDMWCGPVWGDPTAPGFCEEYVKSLFALYESWGYKAFKWDTLPWAILAFNHMREKMHDPSVMPEVAYRRMIAAGREAVGEKTYLLSCSGEWDQCNLAAAEVFDAMRIGGDIFTWENFLKSGVQRILRYQPLHGTLILSDVDNLVLRPEFSTTEQARTRVSIYGLCGVPVTIGDTIESLDDGRIEMLRRIMPVVPVAPASLARAETSLDGLFRTEAGFSRPWGDWKVVAYSNFDTNSASRVSISAAGCAVWDFWRDELLSDGSGGPVSFDVAPCDTRVVRVTPLAADGATLLSVSRHITQGGYELESFESDAHSARGAVKCPGGETVKVTLLLPKARGAVSASHPHSVAGDVLRLRIAPESKCTVEWKVSY